MTWSPSPSRSSPWSTKTQTSWSPIAGAAAPRPPTESTPPDSPSSTLSRADLLAHARHRVRDDVARLPARFALADFAHEALEHARALECVRDLGVELHAVVATRFVGHRGERRVGRCADRDETGRQRVDTIAVAHPDVEHGTALRVVDDRASSASSLHGAVSVTCA